jgi:hypothetical protein
MPFSNIGPREVGKLLDQLKTVVDPSGRPEMSLLMVPHVAIGLAVLAQKQQASITDLSHAMAARGAGEHPAHDGGQPAQGQDRVDGAAGRGMIFLCPTGVRVATTNAGQRRQTSRLHSRSITAGQGIH